MSDARWQRLQELFEALVALPPADREAWLATQPDEASLKQQALALAQADAPAEQIASPITRELRQAASLLQHTASPQRLGPYRLLRELGAGGMGTVFLAERADDSFRQQVAIKLLRGLPTRSAAERMRRERQILADLAHPNIARLLDGGETADGQPYLVMEYIEGRDVVTYAATLPIADRLRLLQRIAAAVHFAHQRLVVHRDLKPANVLVRRDGTPMLLDFGIAKLLDEDHAGSHAPTQAWFTPGYASPEQRRGEAVSTAADVYALGALLAESLSGDFAAPDAQGNIVPPSRRGLTGLPRTRLRELDAIVERATEPEPTRRYASAEAFAADIERFQREKPVHAGPDRSGYRIRKFLRRHRYATLGGIAMLVLAIGFTWRLAIERNHALAAQADARRESAAAESVSDYLVSLFDAASPEQIGARQVSPRELIDRGRSEIDSRLAAQPEQRARLLAALGDIYQRIGLVDPAIDALEHAIALQRETDPESPRIGTSLHALGRAYQLAERYDLAAARLDEARQEFEHHDATPAQMSDLLADIGPTLAHRGHVEDGIAAARNAVALAELAYGNDDDRVAVVMLPLSETLRLGNQLDEARSVADRAVTMLRARRAKDDPQLITALGHLSEIVIAQGDLAKNEALLREMLAARAERFPPDSQMIIVVRNNLATGLYLQGRVREAADEFAAIVAALRPQRQKNPTRMLIPLNNLASIREQTGDYAAAESAFREVLDRTQSDDHDAENPRLATFRQNLGRTLMFEGRLDEAWPLLAHRIEGSSDAMELQVERARQLFHQGEWMRRRGRKTDALDYFARADAAFTKLYPEQNARQGTLARARALLWRDEGKLDDAETEMRRAVRILTAKSQADGPATLEAKVDLATLLAQHGKTKEAREIVADVDTPVRAKFVEQSPTRLALDALRKQLAE
jgi:tetratricopeptide (TPR) repeat protein